MTVASAGPTWRRLDTVRSRLVLLAAIAGVPVVLMAGVVVWQNYRLAADAASQQASVLRESAAARIDIALQVVRTGLQHVALAAPDLLDEGTAACEASLAAALVPNQVLVADLRLFDADGHLRCAAPPEKSDTPLPSAVLEEGLIGPEAGRKHPASVVLRLPGGGALVGGLRREWVARVGRVGRRPSAPVWLAQAPDRLVGLNNPAQDTIPSAAVLARLLEAPTVLQSLSIGGTPYAYASRPLARGLVLLVAAPATRARLLARWVLVSRIFELALLLALGLGSLVIGANRAVVSPLATLGEVVARWRDGGGFAPRPPGSLPREVQQLSDSFAAATAKLDQREAQLSRAVAQQELAMQEIHHRVKNNLQVVASLLNLQASRIRQPAARAEFQSARDRVRALATLHRHLYVQGELHTINMRSFLTELCGQLFQAMGETPGTRIGLEIEASELQMLSDQAVPIALIVTEAVSNAVKYAFPAGRTGRVAVRLAAQGGMAELVVEDDGVGIPAGRVETETGTRDGLGLQLIRGFARQLGATLSVDEGGGTRYRVLLPLNRERPEPPLGAGAVAAVG